MSVPTVAVPPANANLTNWPVAPVTVNTACGEPSFTSKLLTLSARSSFNKFPALADNTTPLTGVGGVAVVALPFVGLPAVNSVPEPSSLIVAVAVAV